MPQTIDLRKKEGGGETSFFPEEELSAPSQDEPPFADDMSWVTHLSPPPRKERVFYAAGILGSLAILVAIFSQDILFTIILALAALVLVLNLSRPHHPNQVSVHATGVSIDEQHHHYGDMRSFWIEYEPYVKELSIEFKKSYMPRMRIPLEDADPLEIRRAMISYVPEKEHESSLLDHIVRHLGL